MLGFPRKWRKIYKLTDGTRGHNPVVHWGYHWMVHRIHIPDVMLSGPDTDFSISGCNPKWIKRWATHTQKTNQTPKRTTQDLPELKAKTCEEECYPGWRFGGAWHPQLDFDDYLPNSTVPVFSDLSLEIIHWPFSNQFCSLGPPPLRH